MILKKNLIIIIYIEDLSVKLKWEFKLFNQKENIIILIIKIYQKIIIINL